MNVERYERLLVAQGGKVIGQLPFRGGIRLQVGDKIYDYHQVAHQEPGELQIALFIEVERGHGMKLHPAPAPWKGLEIPKRAA